LKEFIQENKGFLQWLESKYLRWKKNY
jgi:hypothetical protein